MPVEYSRTFANTFAGIVFPIDTVTTVQAILIRITMIVIVVIIAAHTRRRRFKLTEGTKELGGTLTGLSPILLLSRDFTGTSILTFEETYFCFTIVSIVRSHAITEMRDHMSCDLILRTDASIQTIGITGTFMKVLNVVVGVYGMQQRQQEEDSRCGEGRGDIDE